MSYQPAILQAIPAHASYLTWTIRSGTDHSTLQQTVRALSALTDGVRIVTGIGASLAQALALPVSGLQEFTAPAGSLVTIPAAPAALWIWLREDERGALVHQQLRIAAVLAPAFELQHQVSAFRYAEGRDLSGYEDGTENPQDDEALAVAVTEAGGSFMAVQQWQHDFAALAAMAQPAKDHAIGRRLSDNEELDDAPESAHVKRTAQEDFEPPAFMLRRSMPWSEGMHGGLYFVAFARSYQAFEAQLCRMSGAEDGITDALFRFTQPLNTAYFWCPPLGWTV